MARKRKRTYQVNRVQGPQKIIGPPDVGLVTTQADLTEKYLGTGLIGLQASLQVLSNASADDLLCEHGYSIYRKMLHDPEVDAGVDVLVQSSSSQPVRAISPLSLGDPRYELSKEYADFVNFVFSRFDIDLWRKEQLRYTLTFGNGLSEIDWEYIESGEYEGAFAIADLRVQEPENYGYIVDRWGYIYGVAPLNQAAGNIFPLGNLIPLSNSGLAQDLKGAVPRYKLCIWTWEKKGNDPRGTSILRPIYVPWWSKQRAIEEWSCWLGRYAQPSIWGTPGPDALAQCIIDSSGKQRTISPTELLLEAFKNFKSASALALPYGSKVELLNATGGAGPFIESIKLWNMEISRGLLGQHLATGEGDNQSRAAAEVHATVLRQLINSIRRFQARHIRMELVKPLIEINFGDVGDLLPEIDLGDGDGWQPTVTDVAVLLQSGYFTQDQLVKLDRILGLPVRETSVPAGPQAISNSVKAMDAEETIVDEVIRKIIKRLL